ncbi:MAG: hypothetical protein A2172_02640 [Candidatus Woykebacteria bacterium RBG_13_40_15]|uniref:Serpin domain-containing protein n=1 Tax=Candidatus Woykebacteria bacterium RBG_13_40_15 TaxID=1802593 RepID=A0A1G1W6F2_9BACT|nr:MAG: hypothetical protein A2172_02640 [Candidatus Woykebacteria bacterium RBG_13_40_15]
MKKKIIFGSIIILSVLLIGLAFLLYHRNSSNNSTPTAQNTKVASFSNIIDANNQFALDYYSKLKGSEKGNIFFSPFSISSALAMTYEGAKGQTASEMKGLFYFPDISILRNEYAALFEELNKTDKKYTLSTANALWVEQDYKFLADYLQRIEKYYAGKATNLDFKKDPERSRIEINNWVEKQTQDKIKNLIPSGVIDSLTRLVLTNAIYFKGDWVKAFNETDTNDENFTVSEGNNVKVPMMSRTDKDALFNYSENKDLQILELPYSGEELSMLILLPKGKNLNKVESELTTKKLAEWEKGFKNERVDIYIPKFKFETNYFMADDLKVMGMSTAFSSRADFSGMDGTRNLYIGQVIHKAFIEVNEKGTEAAAATAVEMKFTSAPGNEEPKIPIFRADHPFIFLIQQKTSGNILFMGRVTNPEQ